MRACSVCGEQFAPLRPMQSVCGLRCAKKSVAMKKAEKKASDKARREKLKTLPQLRAEAQAAFNAYIRARDYGRPCICCGRFPQSYSLRGGDMDAGHYRSRGACPELAFDERNVHAQLKVCNRHSWDVAGYRAELIRRIGIDQVLDLEGPHPPKKYTREDYARLKAEYKAKARALMDGIAGHANARAQPAAEAQP